MIVHYCLSEYDCKLITENRLLHAIDGNSVTPGDILPAAVVRRWNPSLVNLKVFLDGPDTYWATSRAEQIPTSKEAVQGQWMLDQWVGE